MDQGNDGSEIVEPTNNKATNQTSNMVTNEGETGLPLASGETGDNSPSTEEMIGTDKMETLQVLTHANSKLRVPVKKNHLNFTPVKGMMSFKQIDECQSRRVLRMQLKFALKQLKKAKMQVVNTDFHFRQERLQSKKLAKAIAIQDEADKANAVTITSIFEKELKCGICRHTFINPTVTNCGHTFCRFCINECQWTRQHCPMCNRFITNVTRNYELDSLLDKITSQLPPETKEAREAQLASRQEEEEASRRVRAQQAEENGRDEAERRSMTRALILQFIEQIREGLPPM